MVAFLNKAPAGVAGAITRASETTVEPGFLDTAGTPTKFGVPVKVMANGRFQLMGLASVAADFYGILIREVPSIGISAVNQRFADEGPNPLVAHGIATRGYMSVICTAGEPVRGRAVYVRVVDGGAGRPVGAFEAAADGANSVLIPALAWAVNGREAPANIAEVRIAR